MEQGRGAKCLKRRRGIKKKEAEDGIYGGIQCFRGVCDV